MIRVADAEASLTDSPIRCMSIPERRKELLRLLDENGHALDYEYEIYQRDGSRAWVSENVREVRNATGELLHYEGFVVDITARKRTEELLQKTHAELESRVDERSRTRGGQPRVGMANR